MNWISKRIQNLSESETLAMSKKSRELKAQGHKVINLSIGEPDFNTPEFIKEAGKEAIDQNFTHYPPVSGYPELREAISQKLKRDNDLDFPPDQIVVSAGAKHSIANVILALVDPGDEVLIPVPYWVSYKELVKLAEGKPVFIQAPIEQDFKITAQQLEAAITPRTKLMIYSSPCNPSGSVYTNEELKAIAAVLKKYPRVHVISDEIYEHINFTGKHYSLASFPEIRDQVIVINGVSKGFSMTGWRLGYMAATKSIVQACDKLQGQVTSGICTISQRASIAALLADPAKSEDLINMQRAFLKRRDLVLDLLGQIPDITVNKPAGAFYVFPDVSAYFGKSFGSGKIENSTELCDYLLNEVHVALVAGSAFGNNNCIRLSYATSEDLLIEAIERIQKALENLK
ncbi:MAG: pyridoxal phosphate-dependent aminotransferase [Bacteroidales bacterium]|jgi:aspartate aminotransferase|nr:pyridoxal phosphate-dependent aminotransferase [Bacteroidales bacterium]